MEARTERSAGFVEFLCFSLNLDIGKSRAKDDRLRNWFD